MSTKSVRPGVWRPVPTLVICTMALSLLGLPASPALAAETDPPVVQVVGGNPVADGLYPFVAAILYDHPSYDASSDYERYYCAGSLVDHNWAQSRARLDQTVLAGIRME